MKNIKISIAPMMLFVFISLNSLAQQSPSQAQAPKDNKSTETNSVKETWLKNYREIKPKVDEYLNRAKQAGTNHPDFSREVKQLNEMVSDFKSRIDHWDTATKDERDHYAETMKQFYKRINEREAKVKEEWNKIHASSTDKSKE
jgi:hypothetical protein